MQITLDTDVSMWYYIKADRRPYPEGYRSGHNEAVLKTVWAQVHMGSNPIPSAKNKYRRQAVFYFGMPICDYFLVQIIYERI